MNKRPTEKLNQDKKQIFDFVMCECSEKNGVSSHQIHQIFDASIGKKLVDSTIASLIQSSHLYVVDTDSNYGGRDYKSAVKKGAKPRQLYIANYGGRYAAGNAVLQQNNNLRFAKKHGMAIIPGTGLGLKPRFIKLPKIG